MVVAAHARPRPLEGQHLKLKDAAPCVRLLNSTGTIGCATPSRGVLAPLHVLKSEVDLHSFVTSQPKDDARVAVALTAHLFSAQTIAVLRRALGAGLAGVLVLHSESMPHDLESPVPPSGEMGQATAGHQWNAGASGLSLEAFPFAIVHLTANESLKLLETVAIDVASDAKQHPPSLVDFRYPMNARGNSASCLSEGNCLLLGGQSVWGRLRPRTSESEDMRPAVSLAVGLDAASFFHDVAPGAYMTISSLVALLASVDAVASAPELAAQVGALPADLLFFAFSAEAWDETGSRRFLHDVRNFTCTQYGAESIKSQDKLQAPRECKSPFKADLRFERLRSVQTHHAIQIGPVGSKVINGPRTQLYAHAPQSAQGMALVALKEAASSCFNASARVNVASAGMGLPPGTARSFAKHIELSGATGDVAVLTDFDTSYNNGGSLGTAFDGVQNLDTERLCDAAQIASSAWWSLAGGRGHPEINCSLVKHLLGCLLPNANSPSDVADRCTLAAEFGIAAEDLTSHYTGVFISTPTESLISPTVSFVQSFVKRALSGMCSARKSGESSQTATCEPYVALHDAYSSGVEPDDETGGWRVTDLSEPIWTESNWPDEMHTSLFPHGAPRPEESTALFFFGLLMAALTYGSVSFTQRVMKLSYKRV